jgi:hypothetical protein
MCDWVSQTLGQQGYRDLKREGSRLSKADFWMNEDLGPQSTSANPG